MAGQWLHSGQRGRPASAQASSRCVHKFGFQVVGVRLGEKSATQRVQVQTVELDQGLRDRELLHKLEEKALIVQQPHLNSRLKFAPATGAVVQLQGFGLDKTLEFQTAVANVRRG